MKLKLSSTGVIFVACILCLIAFQQALATELPSEFQDWQSFENQNMLDDYQQSTQKQRKELRSNIKSAVVNSFHAIGISETSVRYMGAAVGLATQDTVIHLNDNKTFALELLDVTQSDRGVFVGYSASW